MNVTSYSVLPLHVYCIGPRTFVFMRSRSALKRVLTGILFNGRLDILPRSQSMHSSGPATPTAVKPPFQHPAEMPLRRVLDEVSPILRRQVAL